MLFHHNIPTESSLICIQDTVRNPCFPLVNKFITEYTDKENIVYVFSYDNDTDKLKRQLGQLRPFVIRFYDCIPNITLCENFRNRDECSFSRRIDKLEDVCGDLVLVIHSLSTLILCDESFNDIYVTLRGLITKQIKCNATSIQVLAVVHEDMLLNNDEVLNNLKYLSRMWITYNTNTFTVEEKNKQTKVFDYRFKTGVLSYEKKRDGTSGNRSNKESEPKVTFSVDLVAGEKESKENVELPFTKQVGNKHSEIVMELDDEDDWDDEEPDNDLQM